MPPTTTARGAYSRSGAMLPVPNRAHLRIRTALPWSRWRSSPRAGWSGPSGRAARRGACSTGPTSTWRRARSSRCSGAPARASRRCCTCSAGSTGPRRGRSRSRGERVTGVGERRLSALRRRHIGFVFQFFHLLPELSGEANVLLAGARARRRAGGGRARPRAGRPARAARRRGVAPAPALGRRAAALRDRARAGQRPVAAAGRRADGQPRRRRPAPTCSRCCASSAAEGRAVVLVTHEASAAAIADRVLRLEDGRLVPA